MYFIFFLGFYLLTHGFVCNYINRFMIDCFAVLCEETQLQALQAHVAEHQTILVCHQTFHAGLTVCCRPGCL